MKFSTKAALAAMALAIGAGISQSHAQIINISGGSSVTVGGWQITPATGITLSNVSYDSDTDVVSIGNKAADFTSNAGLGIVFTQVGSAAASIDIGTESISNNTGTNWTAFKFSLSGGSVFDGVGDVFVPPVGTGVNFSSVQLLPGHVELDYTGSQTNGATSAWGSANPGDDLLIDTSPIVDGSTSFTFTETPTGTGGGGQPSVVPLPSAVWQSLVGMAGLSLLPLARRLKSLIA